MKFILQQALAIFTICFISLFAVAEQARAAAPEAPAEYKPAEGNTSGRIYGKVVKTMDAGNYTYVQVSDGEKEHWAAGPNIVLKKGDMIGFDTGMPFKNFESKTLNQTFKMVYFVSSFSSDQPGQQALGSAGNSANDPHAGAGKAASAVALKGIKKAKGGKTIAEVLEQKQKLAGKTVLVRGKVTKYSSMVMNKNWLHIQDSSTAKDLIVTTDQQAKIGDLVLVKGTVAVDQDLGSGYVYELIVEKAKVSVE